MNNLRNMTLEQIYLEWVNDWLSTDRMAEHYGIQESELINVVGLAKFIRERDLSKVLN